MLYKLKQKVFIVFYILCIALFLILFVQSNQKSVAQDDGGGKQEIAKPNKEISRGFELIITANNGKKLPKAARTSIIKALERRWNGLDPQDGKFYVPNLRWEKNWAFMTIFFYEKGVTYAGEGDSPLSNAFVMMVSKDKSKKWHAARSDESEANLVMRNIPDSQLSMDLKESILFKPEGFSSSEPIGILNDNKISTQAASRTDYKLPWDKGDKNFTISRTWHGSGSSQWGASPDLAVDFKHPTNSSILSPINGTVHVKCLNTGNKKQGMIAIKALGTNEIINIWHLNKDTVPSDIQTGGSISQGQYLGRMVEGNVDERSSSCPMYSVGTHVHIVYPYKPFTIDSYTFHNNDSVSKSGQTITIGNTKIISTNSTSNSCTPPTKGSWTIKDNCILSSSKKLAANLQIDQGKTLTISGNIVLDMDLNKYSILINKDSKLIIKNGAKIN